MIGVVVTVAGTLGTDDGLYRAAAEHLLRELLEERSIPADGRVAADFARRLGRFLARPDPAALGPLFDTLPAGAMSLQTLEARFRMAATELAGAYFVPFNDAAPTLARLRDLQIPRVIYSNGWACVEHRKAEMLGFDGPVVVGEDVDGWNDRRSVAVYATLAATLKLPSDRIWFVSSDALGDIVPARAAGFCTVWVNRNGAPYPRGASRPDFIVSRFDEVLGVLSGPYMQAALGLRQVVGASLQFRLGRVVPADPMKGSA